MAPYHKIMIKVKMTAPLKWRAFLLNVLQFQFLSLTLTVDTLLHEESKGDNIGAMPKLLDFVKYENSTLLEPNMYANIKNFQDQNIFDVDYDSLGESLHAGRSLSTSNSTGNFTLIMRYVNLKKLGESGIIGILVTYKSM